MSFFFLSYYIGWNFQNNILKIKKNELFVFSVFFLQIIRLAVDVNILKKYYNKSLHLTFLFYIKILFVLLSDCSLNELYNPSEAEIY